jgi:hypothetical protein
MLISKNCITKKESMVNITPIDGSIKWTRKNSCKYMMNKTVKDILEKNGIKHTQGNDWVVYMPCTYNKIDREVKSIKPSNRDQRFFILNNGDQLSGKNAVWTNLVQRFGRSISTRMMPRTYILHNNEDIDRLKREYDPKKIYILKKNIQRQKGLLITKNINIMVNGYKNNYVIAQELLQDPYTINGRKINMRVYILIVCKNNDIGSYFHKDGFMYYTREPFVKGSLEDGPNITTGYIDRKIYEKNPLTHDDFRAYLDNHNREMVDKELDLISRRTKISKHLFDRIKALLRNVIIGVKHKICSKQKLKSHITFQLFGADIAVNNELIPQLMEVNKGPDLGAKDDRDRELKYRVVEDVFKVLKIIPNSNHSFIEMY